MRRDSVQVHNGTFYIWKIVSQEQDKKAQIFVYAFLRAYYQTEKAVNSSRPLLHGMVENKMIFQNRSKLRGLVARIGVVVITSRARDAQIGRFWKIVSQEQDKKAQIFVYAFLRAYYQTEKAVNPTLIFRDGSLLFPPPSSLSPSMPVPF